MIVANKVDLEEAAEKIEQIRRRFPRREVMAISAATGEGVEALKKHLGAMVARKMDA